MKLIISPLKIEINSLVSSLEDLGLIFEKRQDQGRWHWLCAHKQWVLCSGGQGKAQFALQTQYAIQFFKNISHILCVGGAGSLDQKLKLGNLIWVSKIVEHDYKSAFSKEQTSPEFMTDQTLFKKFQENPKLISGLLASGDEDIFSTERANELFQETKAIAVSWESAGGARTAQFNKIPYNELRVITDNARDQVALSFQENIEQGMKRIALFLAESF